MKRYISLFMTMLKIGLFTFGGGYAMIALLENEFVSKRKWIEQNEFLDMVAIAESTPGPIAVNMATFVGSAQGGILGSFFCDFGCCFAFVCNHSFNRSLYKKLVNIQRCSSLFKRHSPMHCCVNTINLHNFNVKYNFWF